MPGSGFFEHRWTAYSEASVLYLMGIGSTRHPIPAESWYAWLRPKSTLTNGASSAGGPLFTHQFSHALVDFRHQQDGDPSYLNYFRNSIIATYAHRDFCISLQSRYGDYGPNMWGITASDGPGGYVDLGRAALRWPDQRHARSLCRGGVTDVCQRYLPSRASGNEERVWR